MSPFRSENSGGFKFYYDDGGFMYKAYDTVLGTWQYFRYETKSDKK